METKMKPSVNRSFTNSLMERQSGPIICPCHDCEKCVCHTTTDRCLIGRFVGIFMDKCEVNEDASP